MPTKLWFSREIASTVLYASFGLNLGIVIGDIVARRYTPAGVQSVIVVLLAGWIYIRPAFEAWLDAKCEHAYLQRQMAEQAHAEIVKHVRQGTAQFQVTGARLN